MAFGCDRRRRTSEVPACFHTVLGLREQPVVSFLPLARIDEAIAGAAGWVPPCRELRRDQIPMGSRTIS